MHLPFNIGMLAHVDAGKTTLTEQLLFRTGTIRSLGSVDAGTTVTDGMEVERRRGITIRAAVASFLLEGRQINVLDTPGHPDFIPEVERSLLVLDAAVLVVSAVDGIQPQTVLLGRTLRRLRVPTVVFLNKQDRPDADPDAAIRSLRARIGEPAVDLDTCDVDELLSIVADQNEDVLRRWLDGVSLSPAELESAAWTAARRGDLWPVTGGSARTGFGVETLMSALQRLADSNQLTSTEPAATVFTVEAGPDVPRSSLLRMWSGRLRVGDRLSLDGRDPQRIKSLEVAVPAGWAAARQVHAGDIARVRGWHDARIGDRVGSIGLRHTATARRASVHVAVRPVELRQRAALGSALRQLADIDPMIQLATDTDTGELTVELLGEVHQEVLAELLTTVYGIVVQFGEIGMSCSEQLIGVGESFDVIATGDNPYLATIGLRVEPAPPGSGIKVALDVELGSMPRSFFTAIEETVHHELRFGLSGWPIHDARVLVTRTGYWARQSPAYGSFDKSISSTAKDFRLLTAVVLAAALRQAATQVCAPIDRFEIEAPQSTSAQVNALLRDHRAIPVGYDEDGEWITVTGNIRADRVPQVGNALAAATGGEGILTTEPHHREPYDGPAPSRSRPWPDPTDRELFFRHRPR
ncbi:elongation factor G [Kribbella sp. CA-293567]|uniref:elongation factor G n=1 Tax=Kribbella sp. CA-293567 TaxID=3002436 RepID=UPI0022DD7FF1|nr:TetM/TetW/TetO/TetS family tetracycline resistance ribosomal protection protein [Kribbella sp. CA-293567]WBQ04361.1 TetM/TetW/TetO/TetS family tetracycline resistance ribosomal protection protein [Kribbella sp. CA-293567]